MNQEADSDKMEADWTGPDWMLLCLLPPACACQNIGYIQETYAAQA
jgi:hypothetical protein